MTCIVGLEQNGKVFIGADSLGVDANYLTKSVRKDGKVFHNNSILMGCTTSYRMIQILQYKLVVPTHTKGITDMRYIVVDVIDAIRKCFEDNGHKEGGNFLIGYKSKLYEIHSDFQVIKHSLSYAACGGGANYANGALFATSNKMKPKDRIKLALNAACKFNAGVAPPFVIMEQ